MGLSMLPDELLLSLSEQWPCRDGQLKQLAALLSVSECGVSERVDVLRSDSQPFPVLPRWLCMDLAQAARVLS